jgi:DNA helicase HerA-like ATPase
MGASRWRLHLGDASAPVMLDAMDLRNHGLICGVTGSGKTTTAKTLAEGLSAAGVAVFAIDSKGDFASISQRQTASSAAQLDCEAAGKFGNPPPVVLWDPDGRFGRRFCVVPAGRAGGPNDLATIRKRDAAGRGPVGVLHARELLKTSTTYADFLLSLLDQLAILAPAASAEDLDLVVIVEEAHLVFRQLSSRSAFVALLGRLRVNGVAVIFITPDPGCIGPEIDAVLGLRIQHALWAFSPATWESLWQVGHLTWPAGEPMVIEAIRSLGIGEALVSRPGDGDWRRTQIRRPCSRDEAITEGERRTVVAAASEVSGSALNAERRKHGPRARRRTRGPVRR